jgi:hypothetical protein
MITENLKRYKSCTDGIPVQLIQAGGGILTSKFINLIIWNKEELTEHRKEPVILYCLIIRGVIELWLLCTGKLTSRLSPYSCANDLI